MSTDWPVRVLKRHLAANDGGIWGDEPSGNDDSVILRSTEQTSDGEWQILEPAVRALSASDRFRFRLNEGDILVTKSSGSPMHIGKATIVDHEVAAIEASYSNFMQRLRTHSSLRPRFLWYLLGSRFVRDQFALLSTTTTGLANLTGTSIGSLNVPVPSLVQQDSVVDFLDRETAEIDAFIADQEELIRLLTERRAAVHSNVFRNVVVQPSAEEQGVPLGIAILERDSRVGRAERELLSVSIHRGLVSWWELHDKAPKADSFDAYKSVDPGNVVLNRMRAFQGAAGVAHKPGMVSPDYAVFDVSPASEPIYMAELLRSAPMIEAIKLRLRGIGDDDSGAVRTPRVNVRDLVRIKVDLPSRIDQVSVLAALSRSLTELDGAITDARETISLSRERRAALISAAVTGKIDVRRAA